MLVPPTVLGMVWFGVFGLSGIESAHRNGPPEGAATSLAPAEGPDALFSLLAERPGWPILHPATVLLVVLLLGTVTLSASTAAATAVSPASADDRPMAGRATWALVVVAAAIELGAARSGEIGVQDILVVLGFPLLLVGFLSMYALRRALRLDRDGTVAPPEESAR